MTIAFINRYITGGMAVLLLSAVSTMLSGRDLVSQKDGVKVFSEPNKKSYVIQTLQKGDNLSEQGRKGMFWKVSSGDKTGFVSVMSVKFRPEDENNALSSALRDAVRQGRSSEDASNVRNRSAVMGVRGLDESGETAFAGNAEPNPRLVFQMENFVVDEAGVSSLGHQVEKEISFRMKKRSLK